MTDPDKKSAFLELIGTDDLLYRHGMLRPVLDVTLPDATDTTDSEDGVDNTC